MRLIPSRLFRRPSPELLFGVFHALLWLLLALQVSTGVVVPLADVLEGQHSAIGAVQ
jgi:hypothetical protein